MKEPKIIGTKLSWRLIRLANEKFLYPRRLSLQKLTSEDTNDILSPKFREKINNQIAGVVFEFFSSLSFLPNKPSQKEINDLLREYFTIFASHPFYNNKGGSGLNECCWIFFIAKILGSSFVLESGTHKGFSAWLFRQALKEAKIETYDIEHTFLEHREPDIEYFCKDLTAKQSFAVDDTSLIFFDDHVNQAERLLLAKKRGFRWALFHGNFSAETIYAIGDPALPTLSMVMDPTLEDGEKIEWIRNGKRKKFHIDAALLKAARSVVDGYAICPELGLINRKGMQYNLTLVRIK